MEGDHERIYCYQVYKIDIIYNNLVPDPDWNVFGAIESWIHKTDLLSEMFSDSYFYVWTTDWLSCVVSLTVIVCMIYLLNSATQNACLYCLKTLEFSVLVWQVF